MAERLAMREEEQPDDVVLERGVERL